jgi:hypothetical protein
MKSYIQPRIHITTIQHDMNFLAASMEQMVNRKPTDLSAQLSKEQTSFDWEATNTGHTSVWDD